MCASRGGQWCPGFLSFPRSLCTTTLHKHIAQPHHTTLYRTTQHATPRTAPPASATAAMVFIGCTHMGMRNCHPLMMLYRPAQANQQCARLDCVRCRAVGGGYVRNAANSTGNTGFPCPRPRTLHPAENPTCNSKGRPQVQMDLLNQADLHSR